MQKKPRLKGLWKPKTSKKNFRNNTLFRTLIKNQIWFILKWKKRKSRLRIPGSIHSRQLVKTSEIMTMPLMKSLNLLTNIKNKKLVILIKEKIKLIIIKIQIISQFIMTKTTPMKWLLITKRKNLCTQIQSGKPRGSSHKIVQILLPGKIKNS